jgi:hypothetical protein
MGERQVKLWVNLEYDYKYAKWRKTTIVGYLGGFDIIYTIFRMFTLTLKYLFKRRKKIGKENE